MIQTYNEDCLTILGSEFFRRETQGKKIVIVTDPPYNMNYHYETYKDNLSSDEYYEWLEDVFCSYPFVVIHYPESIYKIAFQVGRFPEKVASWVYNSNTAKQHRDIAYFDVIPDFNLVRQPYKNPTDKRVKRLMANGSGGGRLYDWWYAEQVKNVSKEKTTHPCQIPVEIMENVIGVIPNDENLIIIDPFMGSGTTGVACVNLNRNFIGMEIDEKYYQIAVKRIEDAQRDKLERLPLN